MSAKIENIPVLEGWVNLTEASEILGVTRQHAYKRARQGGFRTLHQIGTKPSYVVQKQELQDILDKRAARAEEEDS